MFVRAEGRIREKSEQGATGRKSRDLSTDSFPLGEERLAVSGEFNPRLWLDGARL